MECGTKRIDKQYRIFEPFLPIVSIKLNFWALSCSEGWKDNVKQTPQLNIIIFNNNNNNNNLERLEYWERFLKSTATGWGSISTVFSRIVLLFVSSIIIIIIMIIDHNSNQIRISFTKSQINGLLTAQHSFLFFWIWILIM